MRGGYCLAAPAAARRPSLTGLTFILGRQCPSSLLLLAHKRHAGIMPRGLGAWPGDLPLLLVQWLLRRRSACKPACFSLTHWMQQRSAARPHLARLAGGLRSVCKRQSVSWTCDREWQSYLACGKSHKQCQHWVADNAVCTHKQASHAM